MTKIAVFGKGRIGSAAINMLSTSGHDVRGFDIEDYTSSTFDEYDVYLAAVPFDVCLDIAYEASVRPGKLYFDLTEDVQAGKDIRALTQNGSIYVPHCGVAPGAVSIIANALVPAATVRMRVGALPLHPEGRLKYALNWSTEGLVNEYIQSPIGIRGGRVVALEPMGDLVLLGAGYEAFNTAGGIGTFAETRAGTVTNASYQTIRYAGHCDYMRFLLDDLEFWSRPAKLVQLLDDYLPHNTTDLVEVQVYADGKGYKRTIHANAEYTAIQRATAGGVVAVVQWVLDNRDTAEGLVRDGNWIANEDIPLQGVERYESWRMNYGVFLKGVYNELGR